MSAGGLYGTQNGRPCYSPAARTRSIEFEPVTTAEENRALLAEAPRLVRAAKAAGLVLLADPREKVTSTSGVDLSEMAALVQRAVHAGLISHGKHGEKTCRCGMPISKTKAACGTCIRKNSTAGKKPCKCGKMISVKAVQCKHCWWEAPKNRAPYQPKPPKVRFCGCGVQLPGPKSQKCIDCSRPMRPCAHCGTMFRPKENPIKACSPKCSKALIAIHRKPKNK